MAFLILCTLSVKYGAFSNYEATIVLVSHGEFLMRLAGLDPEGRISAVRLAAHLIIQDYPTPYSVVQRRWLLLS